MKRVLSLIILFSLALCLVSCGGADDSDVLHKTGTLVTEETSTGTSAAENIFVKGENSGKTYRSSFIGIGITLNDEWTLFGEESLKGLTNSVTIFDMYALTGSGSSITVIFEDLTITGNADMSSGEYAEKSAPETVASLERLGYEINCSDAESITVGGSAFDCITLSGTLSGSGVNIYEKLLCKKCGSYMALITVGANTEETVSDILSLFTKV